MTNFILPDIGEGVDKVTVTEILVEINQPLTKDEIVIIVESEKASMEIPIDDNCIVKDIYIKDGDEISPGDPILKINSSMNSDENESTHKNIDNDINLQKSDESKSKKDENNNTDKSIQIYASPSVRKLARQLDCDLATIKGTGENGRILSKDIHNQLDINKTKSNRIDENQKNNIFDNCYKWGLTEKIKLNNIKIITGKRLHDSWTSIPHVTQFDQCDITDLDKIRNTLKEANKNKNIKISFIPFFIKALVKTLQDLPIFNSSLSTDQKFIYRKKYYNVGVAINTDNGLLVPVIKNIDTKSIKQISEELTKTIIKAKNKKLSPNDLSGGCMTITSLGGIGGTYFTPIINPPEVAILGISKIEVKPILINNKFKARKVMPISLSYDHRVIDGAIAAKFVSIFSSYISNPSQLR